MAMQLNNNALQLINSFSEYYQKTITVLNEFGGPSVYFHKEAISAFDTEFLSDRHIEMIYATLTAWGMHRMGPAEKVKAKLVEYEIFKNSIIGNKNSLMENKQYSMQNTAYDEYRKILVDLKPVFLSLQISVSNATVVSNSKALAHLLPDLIPPIDRQYTIRFFSQDNNQFFTENGKYKAINISAEREEQFNIFLEMCCNMKKILDSIGEENVVYKRGSLNSSIPKVIDNLIMCYVKDVKYHKKA